MADHTVSVTELSLELPVLSDLLHYFGIISSMFEGNSKGKTFN